LEPPPQFGIPDAPTRDAPIMRITVPVTIGGKMRLRILVGMRDIAISKKEQISEVPARYNIS
jgi:hypothetical protein